MSEFAHNVVSVNIEQEMRSSYLDYSMSVIVGRALPDVRDGLKPVHRRILYAMYREGMLSNRRYSKCAGVVGEVLKKYHPHGDSAVYDALVRMAQPWNMRHRLVDGQGNFGSVDGDAAAAYRYTECRMTRLSEELLRDIDKETVPFLDNFDGTTQEPEVLPARFPCLLVNGSEGIAVGMATKIPPHNLGEIIDGCIALLEDPTLGLAELMEHVPAPDFPTAGTIYGRAGVLDAYRTGRGRLVVRGRASYEESQTGRVSIIIDQLPFQVNKARLVEEIASLVKERRIDGISGLRDESDRRGMRVVVELKRDAVADVVINQLYKHSSLQATFGVNLLSIVDGRPQVLSLKGLMNHYLAHRRVVTTRRIQHELRRARARMHVLEGYRKALDHLDAVIALIRSSPSPKDARDGLMEQFDLTDIQAQAILDLRLQRLTALERDRIEEEYAELGARIEEYEEILGDDARLRAVVREELEQVRDKYADPRRTQIVEDTSDLSITDLIAEENQIVTLTHAGYIKRTRQDQYHVQRRGGMGRKAMRTRSEDFVTDIFLANTHDTLLVFTSRGRMFKVPVYALPEARRDAKGIPIVNLVSLDTDETVAAVRTVPSLEEEYDLVFCSRQGYVKRTALSAYTNVRSSGIIACYVADDDELLSVRLYEPAQHILLASKTGYTIRFEGGEVRSMGRTARGVKGIDLRRGDEVVHMEVLEDDPDLTLLTATSDGFGKRTRIDAYRQQRRAGMGLIDIKTGDRNGHVVGALQVDDDDCVMLVTDTGRAIQFRVSSIRVISRNTKGVKLMQVGEDERVVAIARLAEESEDETEGLEE